MKRIFFSLLACGMFASTIAQPEISKKANPEVSEKWVITPVPNMKGVLGRLDINFPADVERNILIYQQADNKFLRSVSRNDKTYTIAPGEYRFTLTNVPVENVPIQKGHETRLKAGFLDIVSEGDWHLYDETKEKAYTSGNKPKKLPLPVGSYQIKLGGQFYPVVIKDGETVEDYTPVEVKDETPDNEKLKTIETDPIIPRVNESAKWVITPVSTMKGVLGRLDINFPADVERNILIYQPADNKFMTSVSRNDKIYSIAPGEYRFTLTNVPVENVPIQKGHETRLKAGFLDIVSEGDWHLYDETKEKAYTSGNKPKKLPLPVGSYQINLGGQFYPVIIKDGETVEDYSPVEVKNEIPGNEKLKNIGTNPIIAHTNNPYWVITPLQAMTAGIGKLSIIIPKDITVYLNDKWITIPYNIMATTFLETNSYTIVELPKFLTTKTYNILLNRFKVTAVPIESGKETRIKAGYLTITNKRTDPDSEAEEFFEPVTGGDDGGPIWPWELKLAENAGDGNWNLSGTKGGIYALPPGVYLLRKKNPSYPFPDIYYTATIKDGEWVKNGVRQ